MKLRLTAYGLRLTAYGLRLTAYGLRLTAYGLRLTAYGLRLGIWGVPFKKGFFMRGLKKILPKVVKPALTRRGLAYGTLVLDWPLIVGENLAGCCMPEKLTASKSKQDPGTLVLRVDPSASLVVQHSHPQIIDKINGHFGFELVGKIKLTQVPMRSRPQKQAPLQSPPPLSKEQEAEILNLTKGVTQPDLKEALAGLGSVLSQR